MLEQKLYHHTHNVTGKKYLGQTTRDLNVYKGSSDDWLAHLDEYGDDYSTEILFESQDTEKFQEVCKHYSDRFNIVQSPNYFNKVAEYGGSLGGQANPNHKTGKFTGRLDNPELYKQLDNQKHADTWVTTRKRVHPRMNFYWHKKVGNKAEAEYWWNIWYNMAPKKSNNRQALWTTDTFEMWYYRQGNDLDFRHKYDKLRSN
tara:strand:- start:226 stop:831 length:606 start_codon:yes stop_codon:yes gene_type:complete